MLKMTKSLIRWAFTKPATRLYPFEKREIFDGARGAVDIDPDLCIYCGMCAKRCPANAITVNRKPNSWVIDPHKCILCSYCIEVCPKKCMRMEKQYRFPTG